MNTEEYIVTGIGVLIILLIYGSIYIMASEKKKKEKLGILFSIYEFISKKIEFWKKEKCVICGNATAYTKDTSVIKRTGYTEGGQLCNVCDGNIYPSLRTAAQNKK